MFPNFKTRDAKRPAVGEELARVLPDHGLPWYKQRELLLLSYMCISMSLLSAADGYDGSMLNGLMALSQWFDFMDNPSGAWLGFINSIQALSSTVAFPIVAYFANKWGRKKCIFIGYVFLITGAVLQALTPNSTGFIIARCLLGQPSAWWGGSAPLLVTELAYPTHRSFLTSLYNCGWYVGSLLAAWATFGTRNYADSWAWRVPSFLQLVIPVLVLPALFLVPESPRYLMAQDRYEEARNILAKYHAAGDESSPLVQFELNEMEVTIQQDSEFARSTSWKHLFTSRGNRHRALISISLGAFSQFCGVSVVSYYLPMVLETVGITSVTDQTLINGCLQIWNLILAVSAAASTDRLGRRPLFLTSAFGMLVSYVIVTGLSGSFATKAQASVGLTVIPFLFLFYGFYDIAFTALYYSYPAEIWPYHLRARGLALTQLSCYFSLFFNIFINPIALEAISWKYYLVFVAILVVINVTIYFFYPETAGHSLEEMAVVFDEDHVIVGAVGKEELATSKEDSDIIKS